MRFHSYVAVATATVLSASFGPVAAAAEYKPDAAVVASPSTSPLLNPCPFQGETDTQENFEDTEVEPLVAVNPSNPDNVVGVYQEDRWSDGGAHGLLAATSFDGGGSYPDHSWADFSACSIDNPADTPAEPLPRATDPWVSFDSAGRAYQVGLSIVDGSLTGENALSTSVSDNGGLTW